MPAYLLSWNPARWTWEDIAEAVASTAEGQGYPCRWSSGNTKSIRQGERVFLIKQGIAPKGIVASGVTTSNTFTAEHWDGSGGTANMVEVVFDRIVSPDKPLSTEFTTKPLSGFYWTIAASGISMPDDVAEALEARWETHLETLESSPSSDVKPKRNPPWQRDELILALGLYVRHGGKHLSESHEDIVELSEVLNRLPIHPEQASETFRNPNGVSMKLLNFRRFDQTKTGAGLTRGNRLEKEVWEEFAHRPDVLAKIADIIREGYTHVQEGVEPDDEEAFPEGRVIFRLHRLRERNKGVIDKAKEKALKREGKLACCVCRFDFAAVYGVLGEGYIEGHHTTALSDLKGETETKASQIALVCSNCHRMLHRRRPWLPADELVAVLKKP